MQSYLDRWNRDGYLVLRGVLPPRQIQALRTVTERVREQWMAESNPDNTPGRSGYGPAAWFLLHLNNPRYYARHVDELRYLLEFLATGPPAAALAEILRAPHLMAQANLYIDPPGPGWQGGWHRDCQFFVGNEEAAINQAIAEEADPPRELHMHVPLVPTCATGVVPGSHNRPDTPVEREHRLHDHFSDFPGGVMLELEPGDVAFFHVNAIHRGTYDHGVPRRTIAVTYARRDFARFPLPGEFERRQGYFAPYQPWFLNPGYLDGLSPEARAYYEAFISTYRGLWDPAMLDVVSEGVREYYRPSFAAAGHLDRS